MMSIARHARTLRRLAGLLAATGAAAGIVTAAPAQFGSGYRYQTGPELYEHVCQGCHMPDAKGAIGAGAYPALAGDRKLQAPLYPVLVVLRGQKAMPPFSDLTDAQVAAVVNYVRTGFGNGFGGAVTAEQVKALRPRPETRDPLHPG